MNNDNKVLRDLSICKKEEINNVKRHQNDVLVKMKELGAKETNEILHDALNPNPLSIIGNNKTK